MAIKPSYLTEPWIVDTDFSMPYPWYTTYQYKLFIRISNYNGVKRQKQIDYSFYQQLFASLSKIYPDLGPR